jgi:hypothetical protein
MTGDHVTLLTIPALTASADMIENYSITNVKTFARFTDRNDDTAGFMSRNDTTIFFIASAQMFTIDSAEKNDITNENISNKKNFLPNITATDG